MKQLKSNTLNPSGTQKINTIGTGTDLTALPQRTVSPNIIESQEYRQALELKIVGKFVDGDVTPDVINNEHWIAQNVDPTTITDFKHGQDGHHLYILGDGQTTVANNSNIKNIAGANLLLASDIVYHYVNMAGTWYQI